MKKEEIKELLKSISSPFVLEKDTEYYPAVQDKLSNLKTLLSVCGAEDKIIKAADSFRKTLLAILREYYKGNIAYAQMKMINQIKAICTEDLEAVCDINNCKVFDGDAEDIPFFRARLDADEDGFKAKDMGVIPFSLRTKCATERFSMPGLPCLYLGNTSYVCWLEMGKPADFRFNVSPVIIDRSQKIFDLTVSSGYIFEHNSKGEVIISGDITVGLVKRVMLTLCTLFRVKESNRHFKSEYVISQLVMLACQKKGLDGVAYISSKVSNSAIFGVCAINVALYAGYPNNTFRINCEKSDLEDHVEIGDSFNYAMYKQFTEVEPLLRSPLWIDRCKWIKNIEVYGQQYPYRETEFYDFDKFLFYKWEAKKKGKT
ncbi:hypothetical protein SAMN05216390_13420 [Lachnospiraceae bacterium KH1T2]|nr:hypothetical protein SAMN05216390_13420 [Lachnospiraceae bacterium KH1T2]